MANARVRRGRKTQDLLADWFQKHGWLAAEAIAASLPGRDVKGMPGWAPEVKATKNISFMAALKQARANANPSEIPFVIYRPPGYGPEKIGQWIVALDLETFTRMMQVAEEWGGKAA